MEMVESKEPDSNCHVSSKVTNDSQFNLPDENCYEESLANDKNGLNPSSIAVNGDSRLDDDVPSESQDAVSSDNATASEIEKDSGNTETDVTNESVARPIESEGSKEDKLLEGDAPTNDVITDADEDRLLNDSHNEPEKESPIVNEPMEVDAGNDETETNVPAAQSPSQGSGVASPAEIDKMVDDDEESLSVEVVPEEKAEIIVREEVDIPMDSPKTDEESGGERVEEKCDDERVEENCDERVDEKCEGELVEEKCDGERVEEKCDGERVDEKCDGERVDKKCDDALEVSEKCAEKNDVDLKATSDAEGVENDEKDSSEVEAGEPENKNDASDPMEIGVEDNGQSKKESAPEVIDNGKIIDLAADDCKEKTNLDDDCEVLVIGEDDDDNCNSSPSELKRRLTVDSEIDDDLEQPAKKLKKTTAARVVEETREIVDSRKERNPAKVYVASTERKKQIYNILETIYKNPDLVEVVEQFETMMLKAFGEVLVSETSNGKARVAYQKSKDELDQLAKTLTGYRKQKEDLKLVVQKVIDIAKHSKPGEAIVPPKVTRSVGLQVCTVGSMYIKSRDMKKSPAKITTPIAPKLTPSSSTLSNSAPKTVTNGPVSTAANKQMSGAFMVRQAGQGFINSPVKNKNNSAAVATDGRQRTVTNGNSSNGVSPVTTPQTLKRPLPAPQTPSPKSNSNLSSIVNRTSPQVNSTSRPANSNIVKKSTSSVSPAPVTITSSNKTSSVQAEVIDLTEKDDEAAVRPRPVARKRTSGVNHTKPSLSSKPSESVNNICSVPLPKSPIYPATVVRPPTPSLRLCESQSEGVMLSWQFDNGLDVSKITKYQLYAIQAKKPTVVTGGDAGSAESNATQEEREWKKIGDVDALPLPMACTLTQFKKGSRYCFSVRAVDKDNHVGQFSNVCNSLIK